MSGFMAKQTANSDFSKAKTRATISKLMSMLNPAQQEMLSLREVRETLRPRGEAYRGLQVVDISRIVGSEGRYADFTRQFLPRHEHLRHRWTRVDEARLTDINLPPIRLYEIGGVYFVRDGNHRVSVARAQGGEKIDAEVISLASEIRLEPSLTRDGLRQAVIAYEKKQFDRTTRFDKVFPEYELEFTATGRYDEVLDHIYVHKYYMNQSSESELPFEQAMRSWYDHVFQPVILEIRRQKILSRFPGRTEADLYVWLVKHWGELKEKYGDAFSIGDAASDLSTRFGRSVLQQLRDYYREWTARRAEQRRIAGGQMPDADSSATDTGDAPDPHSSSGA
ncbi:MAG: transcriptional regulator [Spirochaetaceae bacterium]|nr:MAG: transcriptional regulator [Spirochaetaceae bacterium]